MLKLTKDQLKTIQMQMYNKARDIDVAVYNCMMLPNFMRMLFTTALSGYQNRDGGFAHALEIDNYNNDSNLVNVVEAFRLTRLAGFKSMDEDETLKETFKKTFNYLYNRLDKWEALIESNNRSICASWYKYNDVNIKRFGDAPTPSIIGYTLYFATSNSPYYKKALARANDVINKFLSKNDFKSEEILSYKTFIELIEEKNLFKEKQDELDSHLQQVALKIIEKDKKNFDKVGILPLDVFSKYTGVKEIDELIDLNLDYLVESIKPHGLWEAPFDWSSEIAEGSTAQIKWIGCISCKNLDILKKFNRIEE